MEEKELSKNERELLTKKEFSNKITVISFFLSYLIVQLHAYNVTVYDWGNEVFDKVVMQIEKSVCYICRLGVPMFFIMSGYFFFQNYELKNTLEKWKSRIRTVVVPWILWGSLYWVYFILISQLTNGVVLDTSISIESFCRTVFAHENTIFWYLQTLIFFIALTPIFYCLLKNYKNTYNGFIILIIVLWLCTLGIIPSEIAVFGDEWTNYLPSKLFNICYFMLGAYIGINHKSIVFIKSKKLTYLGVMGCVLCFIIIHVVGEQYMNGFLLSVFCVSFWYVVDFFSWDKTMPWYVSISFFIYCAHVAILNVLEKVILMIGGRESAVWALGDFMLAPMLTMSIILLAAYSIRRFVPMLWQILNGGRG